MCSSISNSSLIKHSPLRYYWYRNNDWWRIKQSSVILSTTRVSSKLKSSKHVSSLKKQKHAHGCCCLKTTLKTVRIIYVVHLNSVHFICTRTLFLSEDNISLLERCLCNTSISSCLSAESLLSAADRSSIGRRRSCVRAGVAFQLRNNKPQKWEVLDQADVP